jgi:hypothetical protein
MVIIIIIMADAAADEWEESGGQCMRDGVAKDRDDTQEEVGHCMYCRIRFSS